MNEKLTREVAFGTKGAVAVINVTINKEMIDSDFDGYRRESGKTTMNTEIKIVANEKTLERFGCGLELLECDFITNTYFERQNLDADKKYTRVGKCLTEGRETYDAMTTAIKEMKAELSTEEEVVVDEIEEAKEIVEQAKEEGTDKLMTAAQIKTWKESYNNINNEGGEGYIPTRISQKQYKEAMAILGSHQVKENIKNLIGSDITAYKISKATGVEQSTLSRLKSGEREIGNITLDMAIKLSDFYERL